MSKPKKVKAFSGPPFLVEEKIDVDLSSTDDLDASHDIDDSMHDDLEIILREEVQIWLSEYGAKLFSLGQDRWNAKQEKKQRKSSETSPTHFTPNKKRKIL